jgi:hypothetical protein
MRTTSLIGFSASFVFFASVAWKATEADIPTDGALTRPAQRTLRVGPSTITVDLDRGLVNAGDEVKATLVATSDETRDVALDVTALEDEGYGDERVPIPPVVVGRRSVILHAAPNGGAPVVASFHLGHRGRAGLVSWFNVLVTPSRLHPPTDRDWQAEDDGRAASVGVATWTGNSFAFSIEPPANVPVAGPFVVGVRVKNTTKKPLADLNVQLGTSAGGLELEGLDSVVYPHETEDFTVEAIEDPAPATDADDNGTPMLAPGAERVYRYTITPAAGVKKIVLMAETQTYGQGGAMDVKEIDVPEVPSPSVAAN